MTQVGQLSSALAFGSDADVVRAVRGGRADLYERLVRRYNQRLFRIARAIVPDDADALDVLQEGYVRAFQRLDELADADKVGAWLAAIVRNEALMMRRRRRRERPLTAAGPELEAAPERSMRVDSPTPESQAARRELSGLLEAAIDALPDGLREVFVLRAVEKMSVHDVSDALAIPDGTVKSRYARARVALQSDLLRRMETPLDAVFHFDGARCDGVTERVMARVRAEGR